MFITRLILLLTTQAAPEVTLFQKREERYPASHLQGAQSKNCGSNLIKYHTFEVSRQQHRQHSVLHTRVIINNWKKDTFSLQSF